MLYYVYITQNGTPKTGLSPDFQSLFTAETSQDRTGSPSFMLIDEIGGGFYRFEITYGDYPWDIITEDLVGVIDADPTDVEGMAASERYIPIVLEINSKIVSLDTLHNFDPDVDTVNLKATGLDLIAITSPTGVATTFPQKIVQLWARFFNKVDKTSTHIRLYKDDHSTISTTQEYTISNNIDTVNEAENA